MAEGAVLFITAWSGVGKTTTGDYLCHYHGWEHLDGDDDMRSKDPDAKAATQGLVKAFQDHWFKDVAAPPELWHPYFERLCARALAAQRAAGEKRVVVSMSVYRREVRDFIRARLSASFLKLECDVDVVVRSALKRLEDYMGMSGKTAQDWWDGPSQFEGVCFKDKYGPWSFENYRRMQLEVYLAGMEPFGADEPGCASVDVSDRPQALARIREKLALTDPGPVDFDRLAEVQKTRWAELQA